MESLISEEQFKLLQEQLGYLDTLEQTTEVRESKAEIMKFIMRYNIVGVVGA